jgi:hypothetical protein
MESEILFKIASLGYIRPRESLTCACLCKQLHNQFNNKDYWFNILYYKKLTNFGIFGPVISQKPWLLFILRDLWNLSMVPYVIPIEIRTAYCEVRAFVLSLFWPRNFAEPSVIKLNYRGGVSIKLGSQCGYSMMVGTHLHVAFDGDDNDPLCWNETDVYSAIETILEPDQTTVWGCPPPNPCTYSSAELAGYIAADIFSTIP